MKISQIDSYFRKEQSGKDFGNLIHFEVQQFKQAVAKIGGSAPIFLTEDQDLFITTDDIITLCLSYINNELEMWDVYYIADALLLSQNVEFENEEIREYLESMTDPAINGSLNSEKAKEILNHLLL